MLNILSTVQTVPKLSIAHPSTKQLSSKVPQN